MTIAPYPLQSMNGHEQYNPYATDSEKEKGAPDNHYVKSLLETYKLYYRNFHEQCRVEEDYYFGRNAVPKPEGFDATRPATARALIDVATDHVDTNHLDIDVPAPPRALARAERLQKFYQGVWLSIKGPVLRTAVRHAFTYGIGWTKVMFDGDRWPAAPSWEAFEKDGELDERAYKAALQKFLDERCIRFPFVAQNINPRNLIWDDSDVGPEWAMEFYARPYIDIRRRYPQWISTAGSNDLVDWVEYWDKVWHGKMAGGQWVWGPHKHGYGFLPFMSLQPAHSLNWDVGRPEDRYQGLLFPVRNLLDAEARILTAQEAMIRQYAWRTLDFYGDQRAVKGAMENYQLFGSMNWVPPNVEIKPSPTVVPPAELLQQFNLVQNLIEQATYPNVIRGVRPRGVSAGFAVSVLAGMGRLRFQGVADGAARMVEKMNSGFAQLVEHRIRDKVTVYARSETHNFDQTIGPDDIRGLYENRVTMKAESPEERERESLLAMRLYQAGMLSLYEAQKRSGVTTPLEEQVRMEAEWLLRSPVLREEKARLAAEGLGLVKQLAEAAGVTPQRSGGDGINTGNQFLPGQSQLQRPGETNIQQGKVANRMGQPSVYPKRFGDINVLGRQLGTPGGGAVSMPSGQTVR